MVEPKRLLDTLEDGFEHELLRSGLSEQAPPGARARARSAALAAMTLTAPLVATQASAATAANATGSSSGLALTVLKWLAVGAVAGGISSEAALQVATPHGRPAEESSAFVQPEGADPSRGPGAAARVNAPAPDEPASEPADRAREGKARARGSARGNVLIGSAELELEAQSLAHVRFVAAQNPERGLELLGRHEARFPHGALRSEARALGARLRLEIRRE